MSLVVTVLGCGTSTGVPVVGCRCAVCRSDHPRNRRLRCALRVEDAGGSVLVDTPPDLRQQALEHDVERVDAVVYTHAHADHLYGLDDLRVFCMRRGSAIRCHGSEPTLAAIRRAFAYVFEPRQEGGWRPELDLVSVDGPFVPGDGDGGRPWVPVPVLHGRLEVYGYRVGPFAYVTDCNHLPEASVALLRGVDTLVLGALRYKPHPTHFHLAAAIEAARAVGARRTYFTHLAHDVDYAAPAIDLPAGMELAYDGLRLELP